ncbi:hypothetical protein IQ250_05145 [Pseudanabaenaceae cyanobacterium LEGE 13415]|nr:hypothetical protein [Pseudanabaenaceae cyanobacterium LEGE 13415]
MPIEIRELVIKASVNSGEQGESSTQERSESRIGAEEQADIVAACVAQVLTILKEQAER